MVRERVYICESDYFKYFLMKVIRYNTEQFSKSRTKAHPTAKSFVGSTNPILNAALFYWIFLFARCVADQTEKIAKDFSDIIYFAHVTISLILLLSCFQVQKVNQPLRKKLYLLNEYKLWLNMRYNRWGVGGHRNKKT